ncbi:MAG: phosphotransferase [Microcella sp.]|uniref:phosphotransferase n=1 Tax=Microcella sp. TaxID=1913979 RepID=UPI0024CBA488|nr:phosphotransferase [Microcella sp.]UYN83345.1 MAG: phosphotransferase [Microcella sp.]
MTAPSPFQLTAGFSPIDESSASQLLAESHGLTVQSIVRLATERDDSFRIVTPRGTVVAKFAHPLDDPAAVLDQVSVLAELARDHDELPVQRVLPSRDGALVSRVPDAHGEFRVVRVLTFLDGELLGARPRTLTAMRTLGAFHARLAAAIAAIGTSRPALQGSDTAWNLARLDLYAAQLSAISTPSLRDEVARVIDRASDAVLPRLAALPALLAHNDLHGDNVLVSTEPFGVTGVLDFGDMTRTPRVADLAIAASYARGCVSDERAPWDAAQAYASGYESVQPLTAVERTLLPELVLLRVAQRALLNSAIAAANPAAAPYASRNLSGIARDLRELGARTPPSIGGTE